MLTRRLGRSDLRVPVLGMGTWSVFDGEADRSPLVAEALAAGANLFDTSPMYGVAEDRLAASLGARRPEAIVATKVSANDEATGQAQIRHGLGLFGTVDLYQIHNIAGWETHLPALCAIKAEGQCRAIGASQGLLISDADFAEIMTTGRIDSIQIRYNPNRKDAARQILPLAAELGLGVIVMQPLRWGVLLASPTAAELNALDVDCWAHAILRWILSDERVTTVLTATETPGRITANAAAAERPRYDPEQRALVESIIARGVGTSDRVAERAGSVRDLSENLAAFLAARRGASYCEPCLAEELAGSTAEIRAAQGGLTSGFVTETGACLRCGVSTDVVRSKTIMR